MILSILIFSSSLRRPSFGRPQGLDPERLRGILDQYDLDLQAWTKKKYRKKIVAHKLVPQVTEEEAVSLLRISAIQATYNARAYCRNFDLLTASQQMALSQLVFQMGTNLEEFVEFLNALNGGRRHQGSVSTRCPRRIFRNRTLEGSTNARSSIASGPDTILIVPHLLLPCSTRSISVTPMRQRKEWK